MGREDPDPTRQRAADEDFGGPVRYGLIAFLVALALLNAQVTVTRLLAYRFFYHFVFFVISLSQLGLAAAGAWVYASRRLPRMNLDLLRWLLLLAASPLLVLAAYSWLGPRPNLSFGKLDGPTAYGYLSLLAILLVVLNFAGGMVLTTLFTGFKEHIGRLYAADLVGASLGCLASVGLMMYAGPIRAFLMSGVAALLAALGLLILLEGKGRRPSQNLTQPRLVSAWVFLMLFLCLGLAFPGLFDPNLRFPDRAGRLTRSAWTHIARTDATGPASYVIDGDAYTDVYSGLPQGGVDPPSPSYELVSPGPDVAIIGVGAGPQLVVALERGATSVLAVDINPTIIAWSRDEDRQFNQDIFNRPEVTVQVAEGRHALRSSEKDFDLIVMHAIDTWTASSQGAYSLTENFLYTSEAMRDLLSKLRPGGVVSIRRWLFWPPRESLRLFTTINDALEREGFEEPERHLIAVSPEQQFRDPELKVWGFVFFSNQPFGEEQLARLDRYVESRHWSYLYRPGESIPTPFTEFLYASDRQAFYDPYPYIVTPASDANPFFFQLASPWSDWGSGETQKLSGVIYRQSSSLLVLCLVIAVVLTVALLGVPLFLRRGDLSGDRQLGTSVVYFGCLGFGFMAIELPVIQVMTLFLGHPTYALSVVLLGLLAAAGAGSSLMGKLPTAAGRIAIAVVIVLAIGSGLTLLPAVHALIHLPDPIRFGLTLVYVVAIGVPLGMPFVAGVRLLDAARPHQVAWAWAVNGATAVVGSCLLMILMVFSGSGASFALAAVAYGIAFLARPRLALKEASR